MPTNFDDLSEQERRDIRDRYRRAIAALDKTKPETQVLSDIASQSLDLQLRLEDLFIAVKGTTSPPTAIEKCLAGVRASATAASTIFGKATAAARYNCTAVASSLDDEDLPGFSSSQLKAIKSSYSSQLSAASAASSSRNREYSYSRHHRRLSYNLVAAQSTLQNSASPAPPSHQTQGLLPTPPQSAYRSSAFPRDNPRSIYPCRSCNILGHWKEDNMCRPEDVRANIQRLTQILNPGQLSLPAPSTGMCINLI